jgi:D-hydroxyproline dehydrogenase subunit beta
MGTKVDLVIVGGGIVGLAHAYMALRKGLKVLLFEREHTPVGASIRNFGLIWPIGQEPGPDLDRALRSRRHWKDVASSAGFWLNENGSLHLAYHSDELAVLSEFFDANKNTLECSMLSPEEVHDLSPAVKKEGLIGGLWSRTECTVYSRHAIPRLMTWLEEVHGLTVYRGTTVTEVAPPLVKAGGKKWFAEKVLICSGADFETLFPEIYLKENAVKCKLQMMKASSPSLNIGPSLCAGLTLRHYKAFSSCPSLPLLNQRFDREEPRFSIHGIHVLLSQNAEGELIIGDSHEYGQTFLPFDSDEIDQLILDYLKKFTVFSDLRIVERWNGVYPKATGKTACVVKPEENVTIVNCLGGAGMTLSFGLAEEVIHKL